VPEKPAYLAVLSGAPARAFRLTPGEFIAGRVPGAALLLANMEVSRRHCRFNWTGEACTVEDMGSIRGTMVNGEKITVPRALSAGDRIEVGPVTIEFGEGEPPGALEESAPSDAGGLPMILLRGEPTDRIEFSGELVVGRDPGADVVLNHPSVSRRHAELKALPGGGCVVVDLNSTAGSFVNGHRFDSHELTVGDRVQIGPYYFQYDGQALVRLAAARGSAVQVRAVTQVVPNRDGSGLVTLLDEVTFAIPPSQFAGILGPSGAGKSTLLYSLSGFDAPDSGAVLIDKEDIYAMPEPPSFGYVPQDDIVHRELTVAQALRFSARLRLPGSTPESEIERLIQQTMQQLDIAIRANVPIVSLSGGQRKRVSVGVELLARPAILYLDEPSSGLDPATEFQLMELLRDLADSGCTIVCTTHVIENAYLMDQLLVLVGGCLAFQGSAQETREYFGVSKLVALYERLREQTPQEWKHALIERRKELSAEHPVPPAPPKVGNQPLRPRQARRFPLPILIQRQLAIFTADWRNWALVLGEPIVVAALVAWVAHTENDLAMFFAYLATLWFGCSNAAQEIVKEVPIYQRERLVGVGAHSYLLSKFLFQTGVTVVQALLLYLGLMFGQKHFEGSATWQLAALISIAASSVGIGTAISALSRSVMQAVIVVPLILIPQILFSGFTVKTHLMSVPVRSVARIMPTFAAQRTMDTSFLWNRQVGDASATYNPSMRSLLVDVKFRTSDVYRNIWPGVIALFTQALWVVLSYIVAFRALKKRERRR
jgi:ABC-type multidrug transport system ATPase subunit